MPISMTCPGCKAAFRLPDELAGKVARCQRCGYRFEVPLTSEAQSSTILYEPPGEMATAEPIGNVAEAVTNAAPAAVPFVLPVPKEEPEVPRPRRKRRPAPAPSGFPWWMIFVGLLALAAAAIPVFWLLSPRPMPGKVAAPLPIKVPPVQAPAAKPPLAPGNAVTAEGVLDAADPLGAGGRPAQRYEVALTAGQTYLIDQRSRAFDSHLYLLDDQGVLLTQNDDAVGLDSRIRYTAKRTGIYLIHASTHNGAVGAYTLAVQKEGGEAPKLTARPAPPPPPPLTVKLGPDGVFRDDNALTDDDRIAPETSNRPHKKYLVVLEAKQLYKIAVLESEFRACLNIIGPGENQTRSGAGAQQPSLVVYPALAGTYAIRIGGLDRLGKYSLAVRKLPMPKVTTIDLTKVGEFQADGVLSEDDPPGVRNVPHRPLELKLLAGRLYTIDLKSQAFDAYLNLLDADGKVIAQDDDSGGNRNARIVYRAKEAGHAIIQVSALGGRLGPYSVIVRRDGAPIAEKGLADIKVPTPEVVKVPVKTERLPLPGGASGRSLTFGEHKLFGDLVWAKDGKSFFVLDEKGTLSRVSLDPPVIERRIELVERCGNLALSKTGLLVSMTGSEEVWVLDPDTLKVLRRVEAPGILRVAAGADSAIAVAAVGADRDAGLLTLDVEKGKPLLRFSMPNRSLVATPDGQFVFTIGTRQQLVRCRLDGPELTLDEESISLMRGNADVGICLSPDGKFVCLPTTEGNTNAPTQSTYVFPIMDLRNSSFVLRSGASPRVVGFDPVGRQVFTQNLEAQLLIYSLEGRFRYGFPLAARDDLPWEYRAHPAGNRLLVRFERYIADVTLQPLDAP